jgi:site-specific DNA recombinase
MEKQIKAAVYIRVSSRDQVEGESLITQKASIKAFAEQNKYELTEIYEDAGISGGSMKERHALLKCLQDGEAGKFTVLIVHRLSRFGRNCRELLNNYEELKKVGITLKSISEGLDFSSAYGNVMLIMLSAISQLEREVIKENTLENRIARGKRNIPTSGGRPPYGRTYNRKTGEWSVNQEPIRKVERAAIEYLNGGKAYEIVKSLNMTSAGLLKLFKKSCGDTFTVRFKNQTPMKYEIPRLLPDATINLIHERIKFNMRNNRTDIPVKYVLSGYLRYDKCDSLLSGQNQKYKGKDFKYYTHPRLPEKAVCFSSVPLQQIEKAVFETIFENIWDVPGFERAIADSMPDERLINELKSKITDSEQELKRISKELNKLVKLVLAGDLKGETIKSTETELLNKRTQTEEELNKTTIRLKSLPDIEEVKRQADTIRRQLLERYSWKERLMEMTYDEKRELLHFLFDGKDDKGNPFGIYIETRGKGKEKRIDYYMYGRLTGLRTLKGDDINFMGDVDAEIRKEQEKNDNYKTNKPSKVIVANLE